MEPDKVKVVIVEDDLSQRAVMKQVLASNGFVVYAASDGESGLDLVRAVLPSLVITDVKMPVFDGFDLCRRLRTDPLTCGIPIIFATASGSADDMMEGVSLGADDYLTKPYRTAELLARVKSVLQRAAARKPPAEPKNGLAEPAGGAAAGGLALGRPDIILAGRLSMASVIEVLQTIGTTSISGRLEVHGPQEGIVELRNGRMLRVEVLTPRGRIQGLKAWLRLTSWQEGHFELLDRTMELDADKLDRNMPEQSLQSLLMDAAFNRDEARRLRENLPAPGLFLRQEELAADASPSEQRLWQAIGSGIELDKLLDLLPQFDREILEDLVGLLRRRGVRASLPQGMF